MKFESSVFHSSEVIAEVNVFVKLANDQGQCHLFVMLISKEKPVHKEHICEI